MPHSTPHKAYSKQAGSWQACFGCSQPWASRQAGIDTTRSPSIHCTLESRATCKHLLSRQAPTVSDCSCHSWQQHKSLTGKPMQPSLFAAASEKLEHTMLQSTRVTQLEQQCCCIAQPLGQKPSCQSASAAAACFATSGSLWARWCCSTWRHTGSPSPVSCAVTHNRAAAAVQLAMACETLTALKCCCRQHEADGTSTSAPSWVNHDASGSLLGQWPCPMQCRSANLTMLEPEACRPGPHSSQSPCGGCRFGRSWQGLEPAKT